MISPSDPPGRGGFRSLWPAFLHHFVHPNLTEETRVGISHDVV